MILCVNLAYGEIEDNRGKGGTIYLISGDPIRCSSIIILKKKIKFYPERGSRERTLPRKDVEKIAYTDGETIVIQKKPDIIFLINGKQVRCSIIKISSRNIEYYPVGKMSVRRYKATKVNKVLFDNGREIVINELAESPDRKPAELKYSVGASAIFTWWRPVLEMLSSPVILVPLPLYKKIEVQPNVLAGPLLSMEINGMVYIDASFHAGRYRSAGRIFSVSIISPVYKLIELQESDIIRFDARLTATALIRKYFITRVGARYQGYKKKEINRHYGINSLGQLNFANRHLSEVNKHSLGAEAGIGAVIPVPPLPGLTFSPNFSGLFMYQFKASNYLDNHSSFGFLADGRISYFIQKIDSTVHLSFKYQYLTYLNARSGNYNNLVEQAYGLELSFFYTF
jgi:hypothetical protein